LDNIPVTFNWFIKTDSIRVTDFLITRDDGTTVTPTCALQYPPDEKNELQTVNLIGVFGDPAAARPITVTVVGDLQGHAPGLRAWKPIPPGPTRQLPVSIALGLSLDGTGAPAAKSPLTTASDQTSSSGQAGFADLVTFTKGTASLSATAKNKLTKIANRATSTGSTVTIKSFISSGTPKVSAALATRRATAISKFLTSKGVTVTATTAPGLSSIQSRAALIQVTPQSNASSLALSSDLETIDSLIVRYKKGVKPRSKVPITGTERVTSVKRADLSLGTYLGFRMYQVDFAKPVSLTVARKVSAEMTRSTKVEFAEPNGRVSISVNSA
jgi:outer membrane protein OmpA-like peptidoglycan-associated protein